LDYITVSGGIINFDPVNGNPGPSIIPAQKSNIVIILNQIFTILIISNVIPKLILIDE
jgi:hypothetical protein